jgi:hypothetical protein
VLGVFGAAFSLKQAERSRLHAFIARAYRRQLDKEVATSDCTADMLNSLDLNAREEHPQKWNWRTGRIGGKGAERDPLWTLLILCGI